MSVLVIDFEWLNEPVKSSEKGAGGFIKISIVDIKSLPYFLRLCSKGMVSSIKSTTLDYILELWYICIMMFVVLYIQAGVL